MSQSPELTQFYQKYLEWLEEGAPESDPFSRTSGLCHALELTVGDNEELWDRLAEEMLEQFEEAGLHTSFPFTNGNMSEYEWECIMRNHHENPKRIAWVREHANVAATSE